MPAPAPVPPALMSAPFTTTMAREAGLSLKALRGQRFTQLLRGVHVFADHPMTTQDWTRAAQLAMTERAQISHLSRIHAMGLDMQPARPFHFTVVGDLHLAMNGVFLHRTPRLPPTDDVGVTPTAAFIGVCSWERMIDVIKVGDWLLHHDHMDVQGLVHLAKHDHWRAGAAEATQIAGLLEGRARSVRESELRMLFIGAGLPTPEVNRPVLDDPNSPIGDLWIPRWRVCVEYEGSQHFTDRSQGLRDISRYAIMRDSDVAYVQVVNEMMKTPRALMHRVYDVLVQRGYDGPPPVFGSQWARLFTPMRQRPGWKPRPP